MKIISKNKDSSVKKLFLPIINKYSLICFILLFIYVGSWPLWISNIDWGSGHERKLFLSNESIKVYYYHNGYIIQWLEAIEEKFNKARSHSTAFAPSSRTWVNREHLALFASRIYYPLEYLRFRSERQSVRFYYLKNAENIRKFNLLSEEEKRLQFNQLSEFHGNLLYLNNSSSRNRLLSYHDIDKTLYRKYDTIQFRFLINSNTELKTGCCGQSGDGYDSYCYNNTTYDNMMQESLKFISWYNHYSLANPAIKMIESKRFRYP